MFILTNKKRCNAWFYAVFNTFIFFKNKSLTDTVGGRQNKWNYSKNNCIAMVHFQWCIKKCTIAYKRRYYAILQYRE